MTAQREWTFGTHRAVLELPDIMHVTFTGPTTVEHSAEVVKIYEEVARERPVFLLADIKNSSLDSAARKYLGEHIKPEWFRGVIYVGANLLVKTMSKALTLLVLFNTSERYQYELAFADTLEEGRALIEKWRAAAQSAPSAG